MPRAMPEAEVTLRFAFWALDRAGLRAQVAIAIDGAHVRIRGHQRAGVETPERIVFDIVPFLAENECMPVRLRDAWRGTYQRGGAELVLASKPGFDVQVKTPGKCVRAECKRWPLEPTPGQSPAYICASAIGQNAYEIVRRRCVNGSDCELVNLKSALQKTGTAERMSPCKNHASLSSLLLVR